ncbi:MAG TPA: S9 family peptidase [Gemmatimonadaceae bacterium]|nr:S9 family peptidase [Gemmatimonadaceae bacterium]
MTRPSTRLLAAAAIATVARTGGAQQPATKRAFTPADWYRLTTVSAPAMSPDGRLVAFTVTTVNEAENKRHSEVWAVATAGGEPTRYTSPGTESSAPRFSADGRFLLFNSKRAGSKATTWALRLDRPSGEAFPADSLPRAGSMPRDRSFVVWADSVTPDSAASAPSDSGARKSDPWAKMMAMARPPQGAITRPIDAARFDGRHVVDWRYKSNDRGYVPGLRAPRVWHPLQLWLQRADGSAKKQISSTAYSHFAAAVSPDGRWIAFTADTGLRSDSAVMAERDSLNTLPYEAARDEREPNALDVFVIPVDCGAGCTPRRVTHAVGDESDLAWSPDGKRIAFLAQPARMKSTRIYAVRADGAGAPENLLGDWRYEPDRFTWLPSGEIAFPAAVGGRTGFFALQPKSHAVREIIGGRRRLSGFAQDARHTKVAYVATSLTAPTELYVADANGRNERRLTSFNDRLNSQIAWSDAERFTYPSVGGLEIEGWLMKPYGYVPGRKYPLVLYIHGGPHSAYGENWFDEFQNLAGAGMFVLFTNPRGSSGYGGDFTYSTRGRWGAEDYEDLMKAVDIAAKRPDVDSTRMGVTGGSYGGFMTAWITTKTNRFRAAQVDRMISEWTYWYGASDAQGLTEFEFFGKPWDNFALYDTLSPIRHVTKVTTPTLLVQSEEDFRTPIGNAELWFTALRKRGVPAELVRYPRSTHELSRSGEPWLLVDRLGRLRQWFSYWLLDTPVTTAAAGNGSEK